MHCIRGDVDWPKSTLLKKEAFRESPGTSQPCRSPSKIDPSISRYSLIFLEKEKCPDVMVCGVLQVPMWGIIFHQNQNEVASPLGETRFYNFRANIPLSTKFTNFTQIDTKVPHGYPKCSHKILTQWLCSALRYSITDLSIFQQIACIFRRR